MRLSKYILVSSFLLATCAWADTFTYNFLPTNTFSGTAPAGTLSVTFTDVASGTCGGASNVTGVCMSISSSLASGENLDPGKALYLNVTPGLADTANFLTNLNFALESNTGFSQATTLTVGDDAFKADGTGGYFDALLTYTSSTKAFTSGQSQTYLITDSIATIAADDFLNLSGSSSGSDSGGIYYAAIHVQNTPSGGSGSGWVSGSLAPVPEPSNILVLLFGVGLVVYVSQRKHSQTERRP